MVHTFIIAASHEASIITQSMAVSTARALMKQYPHAVSNIDKFTLDTTLIPSHGCQMLQIYNL